MYFPQQSPSVAPKLPHHDQTWNRSHPSLGPQQPIGPIPQSPGYAIYTNGVGTPMHHPHMPTMQHHHHQNSLSHFPSPPNGHILAGSPAAQSGQIVTPHWQQQLLKCEVRHPYSGNRFVLSLISLVAGYTRLSFPFPPSSCECIGGT
jgi:CCR4-NOT transcription complex subunit 6